MKKTTVVIPNYNGITYLEKCLETLRKPKEHIFDIILVDNGSVDGSRELVADKFPDVQVIAFEENRGFCEAVNAGIKAAVTPYVFLLNNDTEVAEGCVAALEGFMEKHPRYFSAGAKMLSLNEPERIDDAGDLYCALGWAFAIGKGKPAQKYNRSRRVFAACAGAAIYRREVFDEIGLFDENHFAYLEDMDIGYRARIYGYQNGFCKDAVVYHAGSAFSGSRYNKFKVNLTSCNSIYLVYKNMPGLQILLNFPLLVFGFFVKFLFFHKKGYGDTYIKGLKKGLALSKSKQGRKNKVRFQFSHLKNYLIIQWELWWNIIRRIKN